MLNSHVHAATLTWDQYYAVGDSIMQSQFGPVQPLRYCQLQRDSRWLVGAHAHYCHPTCWHVDFHVGDRTFILASPRLWNMLPVLLCLVDSYALYAAVEGTFDWDCTAVHSDIFVLGTMCTFSYLLTYMILGTSAQALWTYRCSCFIVVYHGRWVLRVTSSLWTNRCSCFITVYCGRWVLHLTSSLVTRPSVKSVVSGRGTTDWTMCCIQL